MPAGVSKVRKQLWKGIAMIKITNLLFAAFLICLGAQTALADDKSGPLIYNNKTFTASIGEIGKNADNQTTVELLTNLEVLTGANDTIAPMFAVRASVRVKIIVGGKTYESRGCGVKDGGLTPKGKQGDMYVTAVNHIVYYFDTNAKPDKIIVYNSAGTNIIFDGKTKRVISNK